MGCLLNGSMMDRTLFIRDFLPPAYKKKKKALCFYMNPWVWLNKANLADPLEHARCYGWLKPTQIHLIASFPTEMEYPFSACKIGFKINCDSQTKWSNLGSF